MRLLVVEDDDVLAQVICRGLREEGHAVDLEGTVAGAEMATSVNDYDVVILDLGLPDGDGMDLCRHLQGSGRGVRVLMLTARDALGDRVAGLDAGADDYLVKPFDWDELTARLRALMRRPPTAQRTVLQAQDVRLDPSSHRVWRGDVAIPLTLREFSLLHYLMSRPGEVVSRADLFEHVWDWAYDGMSNVIEVHVAGLRRKLGEGPPGAPPLIETLRGAGYRLNP
jgi:two-component system OmpR family response regulator